MSLPVEKQCDEDDTTRPGSDPLTGSCFSASRPTSRRAVLAGAAAMSAFAVAGMTVEGHAAPAALRFRYVLTDRRYTESLGFSRPILGSHGADRLEVTDGLTRIWMDVLDPLWRAGGGPVAGLTRHETWACLAEQARGHGRRSMLVAWHTPDPASGAIRHRMALPHAQDAGAWQEQAISWPRMMARLVRQFPAARQERGSLQIQTPLARASASHPLVTWIIG